MQLAMRIARRCAPAAAATRAALGQTDRRTRYRFSTLTKNAVRVRVCSPKKRSGGRLKQDLDEDLQLHRILILLYTAFQ